MKRWSKLSVKVLSLMISVLMMLGIVLFMDGEKVDAARFNTGGIYGELYSVSDIEFDDLGNMYIASQDHINVITPEGQITKIQSGGKYGTFSIRNDIEFDSLGNLYTVDNSWNRINKITPDGTLTTVQHGGIYGILIGMICIEFDSEDNLYIANSYRNMITKISTDGTIKNIYSGEEYGTFSSPNDIKFDSEGNMWIGYHYGFNIIEANGEVYEFEIQDTVHDIEFDNKGNIYLLNFNSLIKFTEDDAYVFSPYGIYGNIQGSRDLEFDSEGSMYFTSGDAINKIVDYSGIYNIISKKSNLLMDVYSGGKDKGVNVIQWPETGGLNQQWKFELLDNGFYKITSVLSGMSLDVYNGGKEDGNRVIQWPYHGGDNQLWYLIDDPDGTIRFMSKLSYDNYKSVLDVYGGGTTPGVNVIQWSAHDGDNQKWYLQPVEEHSVKFESNGGSTIDDKSHLPGVPIEEPTYPTKENLVFGGWYKDEALTKKWNFAKDKMPSENITLYAKWEQDYSGVYIIKSKNSDLVMDVYGGGIDQGVNIIQWPQHGRSNQQWKFESLGNGYYKICSMLSGMSIDVFGGGTTLGNRVIQWPYHGGTNQQWKIIKNNDDTISLMSRLAEDSETGYILDVFGGGKDQGINVIQWTGHYGNNQKWILENIGK